jgi:uncharacterized membrane protein YobD (UPF0266 family)
MNLMIIFKKCLFIFNMLKQFILFCRCGDVILSVNNYHLSDIAHSHAVSLLKHVKGTVALNVVSWPGTVVWCGSSLLNALGSVWMTKTMDKFPVVICRRTGIFLCKIRYRCIITCDVKCSRNIGESMCHGRSSSKPWTAWCQLNS